MLHDSFCKGIVFPIHLIQWVRCGILRKIMKRLTDDGGICVNCEKIGSCNRNCDIKCIYDKLKHYEDLEDQLKKTYGNCDNILDLTIELLIKHASDIDMGKPIKARLLTDETVDQWIRWKKAKEEDRLIEFPYKSGVSEVNGKRIYTRKR